MIFQCVFFQHSFLVCDAVRLPLKLILMAEAAVERCYILLRFCHVLPPFPEA